MMEARVLMPAPFTTASNRRSSVSASALRPWAINQYTAASPRRSQLWLYMAASPSRFSCTHSANSKRSTTTSRRCQLPVSNAWRVISSTAMLTKRS